MRKATQKVSGVNLGTKRACPQCGTKFYDFNRTDLTCPKCEAQVTQGASDHHSRGVESRKVANKSAPRAVVKDSLVESEDVVIEGDDHFESMDELDDEDEDLVDDINVDGGKEEDNY